jgi:hypothetical protein
MRRLRGIAAMHPFPTRLAAALWVAAAAVRNCGSDRQPSSRRTRTAGGELGQLGEDLGAAIVLAGDRPMSTKVDQVLGQVGERPLA